MDANYSATRQPKLSLSGITPTCIRRLMKFGKSGEVSKVVCCALFVCRGKAPMRQFDKSPLLANLRLSLRPPPRLLCLQKQKTSSRIGNNRRFRAPEEYEVCRGQSQAIELTAGSPTRRIWLEPTISTFHGNWKIDGQRTEIRERANDLLPHDPHTPTL